MDDQEMFQITEATREGSPITAAIIGGSGSGKTYSALLLARGLVGPEGRITIIDAEGGRSKIYAGDPDIGRFFHLDLVEPYTSDRFRRAFQQAAKQSDAIVIDSASAEHEGFLEFSESEEKRLKDRRDVSRARWVKPKAARKRFYNAIASSHAHTIVTIRLNRIVDMEAKPPKEIFKPECDKDLPYRMDLSVELGPDHKARYIKVPKPLIPFVEDGVAIEVRHGQILAADNGSHGVFDDQTARVIANLEETAMAGLDTYKTAYEAAWRGGAPDNAPEDTRTITPRRAELQKHHQRLKRIATDADAADADATQNAEHEDQGR